MKLYELFNDPMKYIQFHDTLNPLLFEDDILKESIRKHLLSIADAFTRFLNITDINIQDIIFTGSSANYNYMSLSDIDVHLITDYKELLVPCDLAREYFMDKKAIWTNTHHITIKGYKVELYVQDSNEDIKAGGIYSLINNSWIVKPKRIPPHIDDITLKSKTDYYIHKIDKLIEDDKDDDAPQRTDLDIVQAPRLQVERPHRGIEIERRSKVDEGQFGDVAASIGHQRLAQQGVHARSGHLSPRFLACRPLSALICGAGFASTGGSRV